MLHEIEAQNPTPEPRPDPVTEPVGAAAGRHRGGRSVVWDPPRYPRSRASQTGKTLQFLWVGLPARGFLLPKAEAWMCSEAPGSFSGPEPWMPRGNVCGGLLFLSSSWAPRKVGSAQFPGVRLRCHTPNSGLTSAATFCAERSCSQEGGTPGSGVRAWPLSPLPGPDCGLGRVWAPVLCVCLSPPYRL